MVTWGIDSESEGIAHESMRRCKKPRGDEGEGEEESEESEPHPDDYSVQEQCGAAL